MAEGPDLQQQLLANASLRAASMQQGGQQSGGTGAAFGMFQNVNLTCFKPPAGVFSADGMVNKTPQARPGMIEKRKQETGLKLTQIFDELSKINKENTPQSYPVQQASIGDITGHSHGLGGGSFADIIAPRGGSDYSIG